MPTSMPDAASPPVASGTLSTERLDYLASQTSVGWLGQEYDDLIDYARERAARERCEALLPDGYGLEHYVHRGMGYVRAEPPSRPGNRGPRLPRWTEGIGWPVDGHPTLTEAYLALAEALALA